MALSVRMDPLLERDLEAAAKRQGVTKSQFIVDAVERALGRKNPYDLLLKVEKESAPLRVEEERDAGLRRAMRDPDISTGAQVRLILEAKRAAQVAEWKAYHAKKSAAAKKAAGAKSAGKAASTRKAK